jgi:hypothetical protein
MELEDGAFAVIGVDITDQISDLDALGDAALRTNEW